MKRRIYLEFVSAWALGLLGGVSILFGTVVPRLSVDDLVQGSDFIVQARVTRTWADWDRSRKYIWTHQELEIQDVLKGAASRTIVVSEPGGSLDGITQYIAGTPRYLPNERVVVFLYRTPVGFVRTSGFAQGKFTVLRLAQDSQSRVYTNLDGLSLAEIPRKTENSTGAEMSTVRQLDGLSLEELKGRIRDLIRSHKGKEVR